MKTKNYILTFLIPIASIAIASCSPGKGVLRDKNLEQATLARLDSVPGNRTEYNARVTTNDDCSEIYSWEEMDTRILGDIKQKVSNKMEEKGIDMDGSLIDALIKLRKK